MTAVRPGMPKLNMPKAASPKAAIAANLGSASRSTGVSYGIFAQRTLTGSGIHLNSRIFNGASISATRHALNDNRMALFNNVGMPHHCNHNQGNTTMNKFMAGMMAMNMMAQLSAQTMKTINEAKASKADDVDPSKKTTGTPESETPLSIGDQIKGANSFAAINAVEENIKTSLNNFNTNYKTAADDNINTMKSTLSSFADVLGADGANVNLDFDSLSVTDLNISGESDLATIGNALKTIDVDIKKVDDFMKEGGALSNALTKLDSYINETLTSSISQLAAKENAGTITPEEKTTLANLRQKKTQAQQARQQLDTTVRNQLKALKTELEGKKSELEKTKKEKADTMDKKYDIAKKLQSDITKTQRDIKNKKAEIDKASGNKAQKLIGELEGLITQLSGYQTDCATLPDGIKTIANSKGDSVARPVVDAQYLENPYKNGAAPQNDALGGGAIRGNLSQNVINPNSSDDVLNAIQNCGAGQSITIGNATYIRPYSDDKFISSDTGRSFTSIQLIDIYRQNANNPLNNIMGNRTFAPVNSNNSSLNLNFDFNNPLYIRPEIQS